MGAQPEPELVYALATFWGRGLATERRPRVLRAAFELTGLELVRAGADPPNLASFRVMERLGMTYERSATVGELPVRYHVIRRPTAGLNLRARARRVVRARRTR